MRGCFSKFRHQVLFVAVLPAYAGMFLRPQDLCVSRTSSPRVCGDVSKFQLYGVAGMEFSPRMRGCFLASNLTRVITIVLPAYAGMFLRPLPKVILPLCSPRVCGDVSRTPAVKLLGIRFSPRMRGCFSQHIPEEQIAIVLPAYAGMFPRPVASI